MEDANLSSAMYLVYAFAIWLQLEYIVDWWKTRNSRPTPETADTTSESC